MSLPLPLGRGSRHADHDRSAKYVAEVGLDLLLSGDLSKIVGAKNYLRAFSSRFAPRSVVAKISKGLMRSVAQES